MRIVAMASIAIFMLLIGIGIGVNALIPPFTLKYTPNSASTPELTPAPIPSPVPAPIPTPESKPDLVLIKNWQGTGIKTTEPFSISRQPWAIVWSNKPQIMEEQSVGLLQIIVYRTNQPKLPVTLAANTQEEALDTSFIYETGDFFLTINAANTAWDVTVFEPSQ